ncbi:MAG: hypothetical protein R3A10_13430 [Caldilineaceae bacterium]
MTAQGADGRITIHFGGDPDQPNFLPIVPGWNMSCAYMPAAAGNLDGTWIPAPVEA